MAIEGRHGKLTEANGIHLPYQWTYANAGARTGATGFVTADLGKLARQLDTNALYMLTATAPTWVALGAAGAVPTGTGFRHVTAGVEDGAAALVVNADVDAAAAIAQSKIANLVSDLSTLTSAIAAKQNLDATLTALAAFNTNGLLVQTAADTFVGRTLVGTANQVVIANGDGVAGNPTFSLPQSIHTGANPTFAAVELGGTAGAGYVTFLTQSSPPAAPASGYREYADSTGRRSWIRASDGFTRTWDATLTANRVYTLPDATTTLVGTDATQTLTLKTFGDPITITQGTIAADAPQINGTVTWNNAGIVGPAWKLNVTATSANATAKLIQVQVGGSDIWSLGRTKVLQAVDFYGTSEIDFGMNSSTSIFRLATNGLRLTNLAYMLGATLGAPDVFLNRDAASIHAWRNGTNANAGRIYNTYTSSTVGEWWEVDWITTANLCRIGTRKGSGGGTARSLQIQTDGASRILLDTLGNVGLNGGNAALGTTATDGFTYIPTCAGAPTGVPTGMTGAVPLIYDTTNDQFYIYRGGWKQPKTPAAAALVTWQ